MCDAIDMAEAQSLPPPASFYAASTYGTDAGLMSQFAYRTVSYRHHGGSNCLFGDGSVRWLKQSDVSGPELLDRNDP
jgi:prepilin-type processing-associated H-X9-DG protein